MKTNLIYVKPCGSRRHAVQFVVLAMVFAAGSGWGLTRAAASAASSPGGGGGGGTASAVAESGDEPGARSTSHVVVAGKGAERRKEVTWLGLSAEETTEALQAQLGLPSGEGLAVDYVDPEGPAAKAGLEKNDVLTKLDDQTLVHPAQLRKLVQARKPGDTVRLTYFRSGKEQSATVTLGKTSAATFLPDLGPLPEHLRDLQERLQDPQLRENFREQMRVFRDNLRNLGASGEVQVEIRRSMEEAQKAIREALKKMTNAGSALEPARKALQELAKSKVFLDHHSTVTVRSTGEDNRSLVQTDDWGTIVLVRNPKLHLTAHDKAGKLLFDGEIDTQEQRSAVPREVWQKVEPLLDKMDSPGYAKPEAEEK